MKGYILPHISHWGVWHETPLDIVCNNDFPAPIYGGYLLRTVCIVVLVVHLVLSVLAALAICVVYVWVLWCFERTWFSQCSLLHLAYMLAIWSLERTYVWLHVLCGVWHTPGVRGEWAL